MGNQGHYIMFFVNQQAESKLSFGNAETNSDGQKNTDKASRERKIPKYLRQLSATGSLKVF